MKVIFSIIMSSGLFLAAATYAGTQTLAHERSAYAVIDPAYSIGKQVPEPGINTQGAPWIYGAGELECFRLQLLMKRKDEAKLSVGYPGVYHVPYSACSFRLKCATAVTPGPVRFKAVGSGKIFLNGKFHSDFNEADSMHSLSPVPKDPVSEIRFDVAASAELPALLIEDGKFTTASNLWEWQADNRPWQPAVCFPQNRENVAPHRLEDPAIIVQPAGVEKEVFDFGRELFGHVMVRNARKPRIYAGESRAEALDTTENHVYEQSLEMVQTTNGYWMSAVPLAFRYLYTADGLRDNVQCKALFHPASYQGAFACSDTVLTRIWMNSAYTLRLCMHDFLLDGIKRDRLPWAGDLAMSMLVNAFTFQDPEIVRRSLVALGGAGIREKDVNGIIDYSLWWIIAQDHYQLYFGNMQHLKHEWIRIKETLDLLTQRCDATGFLIPGNSWLFIDWVEQSKWTALQVLYWWAQESGARLAHRMGDTKAEGALISSADRLKNNLRKKAWSETGRFWMSDPDSLAATTRHPNFLAVISGLAAEDQFDGIRQTLENRSVEPVGTPYMAGFENMALARLGNIRSMLERVRDYWGGMLEQGATTFWEAYDSKQTGDEQYAFYGRPYGKSLCHAWSAGPAAVLPSEIFGIRPLEDGWKRFSAMPNLGKLDWACGAIPTTYGAIEIEIEKKNIRIKVPANTTLQWKGKSIAGPTVVNDVY